MESGSRCPTDRELAAWRADGEPEGDIRMHVEGCARCQAREDASASTVADSSPATHRTGRRELELPHTLGRYQLLAVIGRGAFGTVYRALDMQLQREVAIKLLTRGRDDPDAVARLEREAVALAKLRHPNVLTIFDGGAVMGVPFLAMELVPGGTLREQMQQPMSWSRGYRLALDVARGVAAVHAAGFVHRDIKPDNVLLDRSQNAVLGDFGLARHNSSPSTHDTERVPNQNVEITQEGAMVGTPAYMAPEQMIGGQATPASDQFALAVTLWELLFGARPFPDKDRFAAIEAGPELRHPHSRTTYHRTTRAILTRALASDADKRWPSTDALVEALQRRQTLRRRGAVIGLAAAVAAGGAIVSRVTTSPPSLEATCPWVTQLDQSWDPDSQATIAKAFEASGADPDGAGYARVNRRVSAFVADWRSSATAACRAPGRAQDDARTCLEVMTKQLQRAIARLQRATPDTVHRSALLLGTLSDPQRCNTTGRDDFPLIENRALFDRLNEYGVKLTMSEVPIDKTGDVELRAILDEAKANRDFGIVALASEQLGIRHGLRDEHVDAIKSYVDASAAADEQQHDVIRARSYLGIAREVVALEQPNEAERWLTLAEAAIARSGAANTLNAELRSLQGRVAFATERFEQAIAFLDEAKQLCAGGKCSDTVVTQLILDRAESYAALRDFAHAFVAYKELMARPDIEGANLGAAALSAAYAAWNLDNLDQVVALLSRADGTFDPDDAATLTLLESLWCEVALTKQDVAQAVSRCGRAMTAANATTDEPTILEAKILAGRSLLLQGKPAPALASLTTTLEAVRKRADQDLIASATIALAEAARAASRRAVGCEALARVEDIGDRATHPQMRARLATVAHECAGPR